jgi:hypothetical protein
VDKHWRAGQATYDNTARAHCILDTQGYKHTLKICNAYRFSTATMVTRTRLIVTSYVNSVLFLSSLGNGDETVEGIVT